MLRGWHLLEVRMEKKEFEKESQRIFQRIDHAFEDIDPDEAETELHPDNVSITFEDETCFVINRQAAASQIWLTTGRKGFYFEFEAKSGTWCCDKTGRELFELLSDEVSKHMQQKIKI